MKFTLSWLKDHLETESATVEELADKLSSIGLEVESVDDPAEKLGAFTRRARAGRQAASQCRHACACARSIPAAALLEVVCGAPNAKPA